jgi:hypothetical protein
MVVAQNWTRRLSPRIQRLYQSRPEKGFQCSKLPNRFHRGNASTGCGAQGNPLILSNATFSRPIDGFPGWQAPAQDSNIFKSGCV